MRRKDQRKLEIQLLKSEGREAFEAGRSRHACPREYQHTMNRQHWLAGWDETSQEASEGSLDALLGVMGPVPPFTVPVDADTFNQYFGVYRK